MSCTAPVRTLPLPAAHVYMIHLQQFCYTCFIDDDNVS